MADAPDKETAPKKTAAELRDIHAQALKRADEAWLFERDNITEGREDQRFYAGDQWDDAAKRARGVDRPMLTINRMGTFVRQVTGDIRQNTPAIKVLPAKGEASAEKAETFNGMIRSIEAQSDAAACYVKAGENAAIAGQGAFRVITQYVDDDSFEQEIRIRPIADPFGVLIDPLAQLPDKSDMAFGYVFERLSQEAFKEEYPDATAADMPTSNTDKTSGFAWNVGDSVRIAEYWTKEHTKKTIYQLLDGSVVDKPPPGVKAKATREVKVASVVSYMISGSEILSGPHPWAGKHIPICFVPGSEITIDGATKRKGMVRDAKDPQKLVNYARTTEAETTALQPKAPYTVTVEQIKGYEDIWATAGTKNHPFLPYNFNPAAGANQEPKRSQPPVMSSGLAQLSMTAGQDLHDVTGIYPASLGAKSNETSGVAIRARQHEGDTGSNYIPDNVKRAISYAGRILCDLIPKIYDSQRIVRMLKEDGTHEMTAINEQIPDPANPGQTIINPENDLSLGEYDVVVSTGPGYLTRQQEMADTMVELARTLPIIGQAAPDLLVKALNFPGGDEIAKRLEKMLPPGITQDGPPQPPPPDPTVIAKVELDTAKAALTRAQTEAAEIGNINAGVEMMAIMKQLGTNMERMEQQLAGLAFPPTTPPQGGQQAQPTPGAGQQAQNPPPDMPDMPPPPGDASQLAELEPIGA